MISLHVIADFCPQERLDRALLYLTRVKPPTVNIAGGAQLDRAMQFAQRVRAVLPNIVIQFRILEDTGIVLKLTPDEWWARYVTPRSEWLIANKITLVVDNETSGDDNTIKTYVDREATIAQRLHTIGLGGVFCRFSTGNIDEKQYALLLPLLNVLTDKDWVSPNEYSNIPGHSASGHLERYKRIEAVVPNKRLNMSIGECGILVDYQARTGYLDAHISDEAMAAQLIAEEMWYKGGTIPRHAYCIGGNSDWKSLQIGEGALAFWEAYYTKNPVPTPEPPPVVTPLPPPPPIPTPAHPFTPEQIALLEDMSNTLAADIATSTARLVLVNQMLKIAKGQS